jgi:hypothetical protein
MIIIFVETIMIIIFVETTNNNNRSNNNRSNNNTSESCGHCNRGGHNFEICRYATEEQKKTYRLNSQRAPQSSGGASAE